MGPGVDAQGMADGTLYIATISHLYAVRNGSR